MTRAEIIIAAARAWIGTPYVHGASLRGAGADCLGLIRGLWRELLGEEPETPPPYTRDWAERTGQETMAGAARRHLIERALEDAAPGDVLLFRLAPHAPAKHAGLLTGTHFIHAFEGHGVIESPLHRFWLSRRAFAFRFPLPAPA
jgi:NlpC/P60 family putative phage cell wall peptidase